MPTEKHNGSKEKLFSSAAIDSTNESVENSRSDSAASKAIREKLSTRACESIESFDDCPAPPNQAGSLKKLNTLKETSLDEKGTSDDVSPDECLPTAFMPTEQIYAQIDAYSKSEKDDQIYDADETQPFYHQHDKVSFRHENSDSGSEILSNLDVDPQEILVPEATLVQEIHQAMLVEDADVIPKSVVLPDTVDQPKIWQCKNVLIGTLVFGSILILALVATLLSILKEDNENSAPTTVTFIPTNASVQKIILDQSDLNESMFQNLDSHQGRALHWLVNDLIANNLTNNFTYNVHDIIERFALVVIYSTTNGTMWNEQVNFLSPSHVCNWTEYYEDSRFPKGVVACTSDWRITRLNLNENNLQGSLPSEIGLLKELEVLYLSDNNITGSIPSFENLTELKELYLHSNHMVGTLSRTLEQLENLETLDIGNNSFHGRLINVENMTELKFIQFGENEFTGEVPLTYGNISSIGWFDIRDNNLTGNVDFLCSAVDNSYENDDMLIDFDCIDENPEISCHCCNWCTFENENYCDLEDETQINLNISLGKDFLMFDWEIRMSSNVSGALIFAGGRYDFRINTYYQMCLTFPGVYNIQATNYGSESDDFNLTEGVLSDGYSSISFDSVSSPGSDTNKSFIVFSLNSKGLLTNETTISPTKVL